MIVLFLQEEEEGFPQITPSTLIFPGGAKVVHMFYCFARYVMIENMKKLSVGKLYGTIKMLQMLCL